MCKPRAREREDLGVHPSMPTLHRGVMSWLRPDALEAQSKWQENGAGTGRGLGDIPKEEVGVVSTACF